MSSSVNVARLSVPDALALTWPICVTVSDELPAAGVTLLMRSVACPPCGRCACTVKACVSGCSFAVSFFGNAMNVASAYWMSHSSNVSCRKYGSPSESGRVGAVMAVPPWIRARGISTPR